MNIAPAIKKNELTTNGKLNINIRVSHKGDTRFNSTKFFVEPQLFNQAGIVTPDNPNSAFINVELK
jgi:hypothetical protein